MIKGTDFKILFKGNGKGFEDCKQGNDMIQFMFGRGPPGCSAGWMRVGDRGSGERPWR